MASKAKYILAIDYSVKFDNQNVFETYKYNTKKEVPNKKQVIENIANHYDCSKTFVTLNSYYLEKLS